MGIYSRTFRNAAIRCATKSAAPFRLRATHEGQRRSDNNDSLTRYNASAGRHVGQTISGPLAEIAYADVAGILSSPVPVTIAGYRHLVRLVRHVDAPPIPSGPSPGATIHHGLWSRSGEQSPLEIQPAGTISMHGQEDSLGALYVNTKDQRPGVPRSRDFTDPGPVHCATTSSGTARTSRSRPLPAADKASTTGARSPGSSLSRNQNGERLLRRSADRLGPPPWQPSATTTTQARQHVPVAVLV